MKQAISRVAMVPVSVRSVKVISASIICLLLFLVHAKPGYATSGVIQGTITGSDGKPASGITVQVYYHQILDWYDQWVISYTVTSDVNGTYSVTVDSPSTYHIGFYDLPYGERYVSQFYGGTQDVYSAQDVPVAEGETVGNIDIQLAKYAMIAGRITNQQGDPISPYYPNLKLYKEEVWGWGESGYTNADSNGYYTFTRLLDGKYRVEIYVGNREYQSEFYDNVPDLDNATDIDIINGADVLDINAQLTRLGTISGTITLVDGSPVSGIDLQIYRAPATSGDVAVSYATTDQAGNYNALGLETGSYVVSILCRTSEYQFQCNPEVYDNATSLETGTPVAVTTGQTTPNINAQVVPLGHITGTLANAQGTALAGVRVAINSTPSSQYETTIYAGYTDEFGHYDIGNIMAGEYVIFFQAYGGYYSEYYSDTIDYNNAQIISVSPGQIVSNINATLSPLGMILGAVRDSDGNPVAGITVNGYGYDSNYGSWGLYYTGVTDATGAYTIANLPVGEFRVGVYPFTPYLGKYYPNASTVEAATSIAVGTGAVISGIDLRLDRVGQISGRVTNEYDEPLAGVTVIAYAQDDPIAPGFWSVYSQVSTSPESSGIYTINAHYAGIPIRICFDPPFPYQKECYNNVATIDEAEDITVTPSTLRTGVDAIISFSPDVKVPPITHDDVISVTRGGTTSQLSDGGTSLLANDRDPDSPVVQAVIVDNPINGFVLIQSNGTFTYTHDGTHTGSDFFTYKTFDGNSSSNIATVTVTVNPIVSFEFSKTVGIEGIEPSCGTLGEMKVPVTTTIVYCYSIYNSGDVTLTTHSLVDDKLGTLLDNVLFELAPGTTHRVQFTQTLTVNTTNVATWTATSSANALGSADVNQPLVGEASTLATILISSPSDDQDGDTIPDNLESAGDADGDNIPNFLDTDSNGNGTLDSLEVGADPLNPKDSNGNGIPDYLDLVPTADDESEEPTLKKLYLPLIGR